MIQALHVDRFFVDCWKNFARSFHSISLVLGYDDFTTLCKIFGVSIKSSKLAKYSSVFTRANKFLTSIES